MTWLTNTTVFLLPNMLGLADEYTNGAGDEEGRNQAEQDMLPGIPLDQMKGLQHGGIESGPVHRQIVAGLENR